MEYRGECYAPVLYVVEKCPLQWAEKGRRPCLHVLIDLLFREIPPFISRATVFKMLDHGKKYYVHLCLPESWLGWFVGLPPPPSVSVNFWAHSDLGWKCISNLSFSAWWHLDIFWSKNRKHQGWAIPSSLPLRDLLVASPASDWMSCESINHQEPSITGDIIFSGNFCFVTCCKVSFQILATSWATLLHAYLLSSQDMET